MFSVVIHTGAHGFPVYAGIAAIIAAIAQCLTSKKVKRIVLGLLVAAMLSGAAIASAAPPTPTGGPTDDPDVIIVWDCGYWSCWLW
jgi:hypothetical protein